MLKKIKPPSWRTRKRWLNCKAILPAQFDARRQLKYNVQPDWSNQIITVYLIGQLKLWSDMISFHCSEMMSYHFTGIIFSHGFISITSVCDNYFYRFTRVSSIYNRKSKVGRHKQSNNLKVISNVVNLFSFTVKHGHLRELVSHSATLVK